MSEQPLRLLLIGAHPDDAELHAGGLAALYRRHGHVVKMLSVTDGRSGHHRHRPEELVAIRRAESQSAAAVIGAVADTWDFPDGSLQCTLELRERIIREVRSFAPDLVLTHRPHDYHPDHRAVGLAVQDASYLVTVPLVVPDVPPLRQDPVVAYLPDLFTRPCPFRPDVVLDVSAQLDSMIAMLACHASQVFEFLPWNLRVTQPVPEEADARRQWLTTWYGTVVRPRADRFRAALVQQYGEGRGRQIQWAEAFEISEYARPLDAAARERLFSFR